MDFKNSLSFKNCASWCPAFLEIKLCLVSAHFFSSPVLVGVLDAPIYMETACLHDSLL